jgi:superfamily II DNA or RNA helicase
MEYEKRPYQERAIELISSRLRMPPAVHVLHLATGAGKTLIGARIIEAIINKRINLNAFGTDFIWITKWELANDAYKTLRDMGLRKHVCQFSSTNPAGLDLPSLKEFGYPQRIIICTIEKAMHEQNWNRFRRLKPAITVIDEFHFGEDAKRRTEFDDWATKTGHIIGLTATPNSEVKPIFSATFEQLAYGSNQYLARPIEPKVETGYELDWNTGNRDDADIQNDDQEPALRTLANDTSRNQKITDYIHANKTWLGKSLIFAATSDHAEVLYEKLKRGSNKVTVDFVLSRRPTAENRTALDEFKKRNSGVQFLICVRKLTHGIDIRHIRSIIITRPTKSPKLYRQMLGRGCRLDPESGKNDFYVVEFTDNWKTHGGISKETYGSSGPHQREKTIFDSRKLNVTESILEHEFKKDHFSIYGVESPEEQLDIDGTDDLLCLPIRKSQTFGFEFEFAKTEDMIWIDPKNQSEKEWRESAYRIQSSLQEVFGKNIIGRPAFILDKDAKDHRKWNIDYDRSCGWEVSSRILKDFSGVSELRTALSSLSRICSPEGTELPGLFRTTYRTGIHLHLGYSFQNTSHLKTFLKLVKFLEPGLATLLAPSRLIKHKGKGEYDHTESNEYCRCLNEMLTNSEIDGIKSIDDFKKRIKREARHFEDEPRYRSVNLLNFAKGSDVLEVRLLHGTLNHQNVVLWLSLWMQILAASEWLDGKDFPNIDFPVPLIPDDSNNFDLVHLWKSLGLDRLDPINTVNAIKAAREAQIQNWRKRGLITDNKLKTIAVRWEFEPKETI